MTSVANGNLSRGNEQIFQWQDYFRDRQSYLSYDPYRNVYRTSTVRLQPQGRSLRDGAQHGIRYTSRLHDTSATSARAVLFYDVRHMGYGAGCNTVWLPSFND